MKAKEKQLTKRQVVCILLICCMASKVTTFPIILMEKAGNDAWISYLIMFAVYLLLFIGVMLIYKANPDKDFYCVLKGSIGKIGAKAVMAILFLLFTAQVIMMFRECRALMGANFYNNISWRPFTLTVIAFLCYAAFKGLNALGRCGEIIIGLFTVSVLLAVLLVIPNAEFERLLPVGDSGVRAVGYSAMTVNFWFGDFFILLMMLGKIKPEKKVALHAVTAYIVSGVIVLLFIVMFIAVFGTMSVYEGFGQSFSNLMEFSFSESLGRLNSVFEIFWLGGMFFKMLVLFWVAVEALVLLTGAADKRLWHIIPYGAAVMLVNSYILPVMEIINFVSHPGFSLGMLCFYISLTGGGMVCAAVYRKRVRGAGA